MYITQELLNERKQFLINRDYSGNTIDNYTTDMKLFINFIRLETLGYTIEENDITLGMIERWKTYLAGVKVPKNSIYFWIKPTLSQATIQSKIVAIKSFLKFINLIYDCGLEYRRVENKKIKSDYIEVLTDAEYKTLFDFIGNYERYKINALRMQLLCNIGYTSGLRLSEMLNLTVEEVKSKETRIIWKGNKARRVFFTNSSEELLREYLEERNKPIPRTWRVENKSDFVFISHNSWYDYWNPIKKNTACEIMKKYSDAIDIGKRITIHTLRHSYATRLLESWLNIREIQELLGHSDIQTTENYCHVLKSNLKQKVNKIFE